MRHFKITAIAIAASLCGTPVAVHASGSIAFEDVVTQLAGQSPKLMDEVRATLQSRDQKIANVTCDGIRLGRHYTHLGGARIPTFTCDLNGRVLELEGNVAFYDEFGAETDDPRKAQYISQSSPNWTWK